MSASVATTAVGRAELPKCSSGIRGLDDIMGGGLPRGRPTLVCGGPGCGKTLLGMEFLVRGAVEHDEPGVFVSFEESAPELTANVRSLGFDLDALAAQQKLVLDHVLIERGEAEENGEYDLGGLFIRLGYSIDSIGAKRVVLDTIEAIFGGFSNQAILRAELVRLFRWLKDKGVTAVITAERGDSGITRQGLEEYVSDCVIMLDNRVVDQVSTRRLRIVKYRGTSHGTNEYPFMIDESGFSVLPITSVGLEHPVSDELVSTGISALDRMLGGAGVYRGSSVVVSGTAGTGKSSVAAHFAAESCRRGERCLYFAFEESTNQILRNMRSIGIDLRGPMEDGLLRFVAGRPTATGLETHLAIMHREVRGFDPRIVVLDPISNLGEAGTFGDASALLVRMLDFLKMRQVTGLFTALIGGDVRETPGLGVSSVIDTCLLLRDIELGGERNRTLQVLKARGLAHSNQIREFLLTAKGVELREAYVGESGVLTGSMRLAEEARERARALERQREVETRVRSFERKRRALEGQIAALQAELDDDKQALRHYMSDESERNEGERRDRWQMARSRMAGPSSEDGGGAGNGNNGSSKGART
jgi:circadian clock protein KaiC